MTALSMGLGQAGTNGHKEGELPGLVPRLD